MKIPLLNIYYLLCYAWNRLEEGETIPVTQLDKDEVSQLFATVLIEGTLHLFKKGLDRGYILHSDEISRLRGKIDFPANLKRNFFKQPRLYCEYDELDYNVLHNQILKASIKNMINCKGLEKDTNEKLKNLYRRLHYVEDIFLTKKSFRQLQLNRNNIFYDFLIKVCELIYDNLLISSSGEGGRFRDFIQDEVLMRKIFEDFVRNFYKRHLKNYDSIKSETIYWKLKPYALDDASFLPDMHTDITIKLPNRKMIIDTKYYKNTLDTYYGKETINPSNLYQLYSYLMNQRNIGDSASMHCEGVLLYPTVDYDYCLNYQYEGHKVTVRTINLNQNWQHIANDLKNIVASDPNNWC